MPTTPNLSLPYLEAGQAQKHVTLNESLRALDAVTQLAVAAVSAAPPSEPEDGERHIVGASPSGAFADHAHEIAAFQDGGWVFLAPRAGWRAWDIAAETLRVFTGPAWEEFSASGGGDFDPEDVSHLFINDAAPEDEETKLAVRSNDVLLHAIESGGGGSGDARLQISKEGEGDTAAVVFASDFEGRAEFGLIEGDDFQLKVSADGETWLQALAVDPGTGKVRFPHGIDPAPGVPSVLLIETYSENTSVAASAAAWNKRNLNSEVYDVHNEASLAAGAVTLAEGVWYARAWGVAHRTGRHKLRLRNTADNVTLAVGSGHNAQDGNNVTNIAQLAGFFTVGTGKTVEMQHWTVTAQSNGLGVGDNSGAGEPEIFAALELWRVA